MHPLRTAMRRLGGLIVAVALWLGWLLPAGASSTIFGGGPFYSGGTATMNALRASGYTTVMLWCIHVDATSGNLIYNDQLIVANGAYVGNASWPGQLATLKAQPTSVNRIEVSVSSWGVNDFQSIQTLMNNYGTNTDSILYRNFQALKAATGADAIDYDDETLYDVATAVKFGRMLASIGYKVTLCPYTNPSFWQGVYSQLGTGIVDAVYLQCYAGGAGNNPATWNGYFSGTKVQPGMWCKNGNGCTAGNSASEVQTQMAAWRAGADIPGGFMWLYDDMLACNAGGTPADYARAINTAVDPLVVSPAAGFAAATAFRALSVPTTTPFVLSNAGPSTLNWNLVNTSSWLTVSAAGGSLVANSAAMVTVGLNAAVATNLTPGFYSASIVFSNHSSGVAVARNFTLNTAIALWPVTVTGFNAALLAPNTATPANPGASAFDIPNNYCFCQAGLSGGSLGLPLNGFFASLADAYTAFQLGGYGTTNALLLGNTYPRSGTLTMTSPRQFSALSVLATSANGGGVGTLVLNFTNGTRSPALSFNAQDWFYTVTNVALQGFGRLKLGTSLTLENNGAANPNLYQTTFNLAALGLTQAVASITFSNPATAGASQTTAILAVSGLPGDIPLGAPAVLAARPGSNATVQLTWSPVVGAANYHVKRSTVSGGPYVTLASPVGTNHTATGLANGTTYFFVVSSSGPFGEGANSTEVSAMPGSYAGWLLSASPAGYWPLAETGGSVTHDVVGGNDGFYAGTCYLGLAGVAGAGFAVPHRAVHYDGSSGYTQIPRVIGSTNFSIAFWLLTSATGGTPNWYNGRGIVDGEVSGMTDDFGVALVGGKIGFGLGNPDVTLTSVKTVNNAQWHHVGVTRDAGTGALRIYIDGTLDTSGTGPTGPKTAPSSLRLGSLQTANNFLNGSLSDVAVYNRVLNPEDVAVLYQAATGLFYDVTLTNSWNGNSLVLSWAGNGKLLEATNILGPWSTNAAGSPVIVSPAQPQKFYRILTR
ncbi:MAG TPA: LamG-like jellyroll fold domain-containing protein [Verrucomicrobiae bacterium]|nr:LamG-like jellyroll fold domain-containing protein [Verrucomicrobiae bacterium]